MRIRTQFIVTMLLFSVMLMGISASAIITNERVETASAQQNVASKIAQGASELGYLANDYVIYREAQQLERWRARFASFSSDVARLSVEAPVQQALARNIQGNAQRLDDVFNSVVSTAESVSQDQGGTIDPALLRVSWSRIAVQTQALVADASRLSQLLDSEVTRLQRTNVVVVVALIAVFVAYFIMNYLVTQRRALRGLARLQAGAAVIGSGNLDFRIEEKGNDEIGDLSRAVNRMTADLKAVTASKIDLEKEIEERKKAEEALRESHQRLKKVLEAETVGVMFWDLTTGRMTDANDTFLNLMGYSRSEVEAGELTWKKLTPSEYVEASLAELRKVQAIGRIGPYEKECFRKDGMRQWLVFAGSSLGNNQCVEFCVDISARKQAEDALKQAEQRLSAHLESSPTAIIEFDPQFRVIRWSKEAERIFGWTAEEIMGRAISEIKWVYHDDVEEVARVSEGFSAGTEPFGLNVNRNYRKDGSVIWCEWYNSSIYDSSEKLVSVLSQVLDVTERKRAEEAVRQSEEKLSAIINAVDDSIWLFGPDDTILAANETAARRLNLSPAALVGEKFTDYIAPQLAATRRAKLEEVFSTGKPLEFVDERAGFVFRHGFYPVRDSAGKVAAVASFSRDITERKKAEQALQRYTQELEAANKELEAFSYSVSHDLRAPLRHIKGFSEILLEDHADRLDEEGRRYLGMLRSGSQKMEELIEALLGLSRVARADMRHQSVDLSQLADSITAELQEQQPDRQAEFVIEPGLTASGDRQLLGIMLGNLLSNAWKFTSGRPIARIEFGVTQRDGQHVYYVKDNGAGFDMAYADKLFGPFQRLHNEKEFPGTGIGLATVQRVIHRHGGRVWGEGEIDKGATFYFTLRG